MSYYKAASMAEIERENVIPVDVEGFSLLLYRDKKDRVYCMKNCCTDNDAELFGGTVEYDSITCPRHGAKFDLTTGEALSLPAVVGVKTFPVKVGEDEIFIGMED